jgi:hypothetical protein
MYVQRHILVFFLLLANDAFQWSTSGSSNIHRVISNLTSVFTGVYRGDEEGGDSCGWVARLVCFFAIKNKSRVV